MTRRRYYRGPDVRRTISIEELRDFARRKVPAFAFEYVDGGAEDEQCLKRNRRAFDDWRFVPKTLIDTEGRSAETSVFGVTQPLPIAIAPTGLNGVLRKGGDLMLARAAAAAGIPFTLSTVSNARPAAVAEAMAPLGGRLWMQLYAVGLPGIVDAILENAAAAGAEALFFTTDANVFGSRDWDRRSFKAPGQLTLRSKLDVLRHPRWIWDVLVPDGMPAFVNIADFLPEEFRSMSSGVSRMPSLFKADIDWDDVARLRDRWQQKLVIKGVLDPADVDKAARLGCDGVVLTNHGGRQLDACVSPLEVLPEVARLYGQQLTIFVDSGFRRGSDIAKAVALGAHAVLIGRATLYGLIAAGETGARHAIDVLAGELHRVMGQLGCRRLTDLDRSMLRAGPTPGAG